MLTTMITFTLFMMFQTGDLTLKEIAGEKKTEIKTNAVIYQIESQNGDTVNPFAYIYFSFFDVNGQKVNTYETDFLKPGTNIGDTISVLYDPANPASAHFPWNQAQPGAAKPLLFIFGLLFTICLIAFIVSTVKYFRTLFLLKNGIYTHASIIRVENTRVRINKKLIFRIHFEFKNIDGSVIRTTAKLSEAFRDAFDRKEEAVLFDPSKPERTVFIDSLPNKAREYFQNSNDIKGI